MKIVIDLPEELYEQCKETELTNENEGFNFHIIKTVAKGTPLPKGHGRLVDADVYEKRLMDARSYYIGEKADDFDLRFASGLKSAAERLVDAPTIIEADKGE